MWLIRAMRLFGGPIVHRINHGARIHHDKRRRPPVECVCALWLILLMLDRLVLLDRPFSVSAGSDRHAASVAPVTNELSSLASKSMARATSSGAAGGAGAVGALIALQALFVEPTTVFSIQYSADMLFMVLPGASAARMTANRPLG